MIVYYAHPISLYGTFQETTDVETLSKLFYSVSNPNDPEIEKKYVESGKDWAVFDDLVRKADVLAYRTLPDGRITSGVWKEIQKALELDIPVIELPNFTVAQIMTKEETLQHLKEAGLR